MCGLVMVLLLYDFGNTHFLPPYMSTIIHCECVFLDFLWCKLMLTQTCSTMAQRINVSLLAVSEGPCYGVYMLYCNSFSAQRTDITSKVNRGFFIITLSRKCKLI